MPVPFTLLGLPSAVRREKLMQEALAAFEGELDVLVNNVGTNIRKPTVRPARPRRLLARHAAAMLTAAATVAE